MFNLSSVHLSNRELRALRRVKRRLPISARCANVLRRISFVDVQSTFCFSRFCICRITDSGLRFLDFKNSERSDRRWTRSIAVISALISLAALIVSVVSLLLSARAMQAQGLLPEWIKLR